MRTVVCRVACATLCLILLLGSMTACQGNGNPFVKNGISSLTVDEKGNLNISINFNSVFLDEHKGEKVSLYELLPGENASSLAQKTPLAQKKISSAFSFKLPLEENGNTKLYSSFVLGFSDGSILSDQGVYVQSVASAKSDPLFRLWQGAKKGLLADSVADAAALGAGHVMVEAQLSSLLSAADVPFSFQGNTYALASTALATVDKQVKDATAAGLQVSLRLSPDVTPDPIRDAAIMDYLASRYSEGSFGTCSMFFIGSSNTYSVPDIARLCRYAHLALTSRIANGRVYAVYNHGTVSTALAFFTELQSAISTNGSMSWGAAIVPIVDSCEAWKDTAAERMNLQNLTSLSNLLSIGSTNAPAWLAVCDLTIPGDDPDAQAASFAYAYGSALQAKASLVFYGSHMNDSHGLRNSKGTGHPILSVFADIDSSLTDKDTQLCKEQMGDPLWDKLPLVSSQKRLTGIANTGDSGLETEPLFDFTDGSTHGFAPINGLGTVESKASAAWNSSVLYTWLESDIIAGETGVSVLLEDASSLANAISVSADALLQIPGIDDATLRLRLTGVSKNGTVVTYESQLQFPAGSWQTATFSIGGFLADADLSAPCVLTLVTDSASPSDEESDNAYVFWLKSIRLLQPKEEFNTTLATLIILSGVILGFAITILLYHLRANRKKRRSSMRG